MPMDITGLLKLMVERGISDIQLKMRGGGIGAP